MGTATVRVGWGPEGPTPQPWWQRELDRIAEPGGNLQWLHLYWEPGYAWEPVERWVVGTVLPPAFVPGWKHQMFQGPDPATLGYWNKKTRRWVSLAPPITRRQWRFYRQSGGCVIDPYWIVQGTRGGHLRRWDRATQVLSGVYGGPKAPPVPGDLCYAVPDMRTFGLLAKRDRIRMHLTSLDVVERGGVELTEDEHKALGTMRAEVLDWLKAQSGEWADMASSQACGAMWDGQSVEPGADRALHDQMERMEDEFLNQRGR